MHVWLIVGGVFKIFKVQLTYVNGVPHDDVIILEDLETAIFRGACVCANGVSKEGPFLY